MQAFGRARASALIPSMAILILAIPMMDVGTLRSPTANAATPGSEAPATDPAAKESLHRMVAYLQTLDAFTIHAQTTKEEVVTRNFKLQRHNEADVTVKNP